MVELAWVGSATNKLLHIVKKEKLKQNAILIIHTLTKQFTSLTSYICCTLRSGFYEIPTMIRTFPHGLENNHACKWTSDNFSGMLTYKVFLENCQKTICMHGYPPIHVDRSLRVSNHGDKSVSYCYEEKGPFHAD